MKATLKSGMIEGVFPKEEGEVEIMITFRGKADSKMSNAKEIVMSATICMKRALADEIRLGDVFTCELSVGPKEE